MSDTNQRKTLATSGTVEGLEKLIASYFYGSQYKCIDDSKIVSMQTNRQLEGYFWETKKGRFYFKRGVK